MYNLLPKARKAHPSVLKCFQIPVRPLLVHSMAFVYSSCRPCPEAYSYSVSVCITRAIQPSLQRAAVCHWHLIDDTWMDATGVMPTCINIHVLCVSLDLSEWYSEQTNRCTSRLLLRREPGMRVPGGDSRAAIPTRIPSLALCTYLRHTLARACSALLGTTLPLRWQPLRSCSHALLHPPQHCTLQLDPPPALFIQLS